ncbi:membrane protein [Naegleria gruberi]|uniref:Membrane protein n=1 Tax=Naegleria gruberi TaxID=5762 RepID=D2VZF2_NAEGR|nr:uncharacterized protein NAEGRDRAFT_56371 [Naegleria gruberi]EFC37835.1 membrane protein [Naegleria gruberi]|eukprot:XP_002670579.1 membrane protein [Naegleria gruberi strain NEG-M]
MSSLELKVPPVLFTFLCMLAMYLFNIMTRNAFSLCSSDDNSFVMRLLLFASSLMIGAGIALAGKYEFSKMKTTVNPMTPEKTSSLVQGGVYRWTRNPMYVGFLACLFGWSLFLMDWMVMVVFLPFFVWYLNKFQIEPEERFLQELFGQEFVNYKRKVKRWLFV